jgi:DNA-binding NarL/FixJ family response regulator
MTITVLLADDQALVRGGLRLIVNTQDDMQVVGEASDGHQAIEVARRLRPDVVLMDIRMPHLDGLEATRQLSSDQTLAATRLLILTTFDLDAYVYEALRAGASGFLLKDAPPEQLIDAIRIVTRGDALLAPSITRRLIERFLRQPVLAAPGSKPLDQLTTREREVLELIAHGLSNSEIAARLYLTEATVKTHVAHIYRKLGLRDRAQAVVYAHEAGLLEQPPTTSRETPSSPESN